LRRDAAVADNNWAIYPLLLGEADVPKALDILWSLSPDKSLVTVPILAWLLIPARGDERVLVDTGFSDVERCMQVQRLGPHRTRPEWALEAQLSNWGLTPEDITTVILTHLHYDHAGGCSKLSRARFFIQRRELEAAAAPMVSRDLEVGGGALFYDRRDISAIVDPLWPRVELIEGDETLMPGLRCVLYANSHTPGSQVVYVETSAGTAAIIGDIARNVELNIQKWIPPGIYYDLESTRRALKDIRYRAQVVLPTHDYETFRRVAKGLK
jgi:N-acyl homoserine lactone hydrolase